MIKMIIGIIIVAAVVIGGFMVLDPDIVVSRSGEVTETNNGDSDEKFSFTIEGEVNKPGTYSLDEDITMGDLIEAAGGLSSNADENCYFETADLEAGNTYYISAKYDYTDVCNKQAINKVNINADSADELIAINGITSTVAASIVSYRSEIGTYQTIEQLLDVYGIGNATYRKVRSYVILHE